ncbi:hypothetical protein [Geobacter sp. AOG2]|uniref:hypothetical protein n=1 Tax=Geobacter sp. AOG2 TaxID=1566347 RepID=UPI001CC4E1D5|nr:hypothetical protein [Geobacter sp. AOG2]
MMEILIEIIGQAILYGTAEVCTAKIAKSISRSRAPEKSKVSPISAAVIYAVVGYFAGLSSLLIFPKYLITDPNMRSMSIIVLPVLLGFLMSVIGRYLKKRCRDVVRLESFPYGFLFAFTFGIARVLFAK